MSDYSKYRGRCRELCEEELKKDPSLTIVRGHYHCPMWGEQQHWRLTRLDGSIFDPTVKQFQSGGTGEYVEFNGIIECSNCSKKVLEEDAQPYGSYIFCPSECICRFVGL